MCILCTCLCLIVVHLCSLCTCNFVCFVLCHIIHCVKTELIHCGACRPYLNYKNHKLVASISCFFTVYVTRKYKFAIFLSYYNDT